MCVEADGKSCGLAHDHEASSLGSKEPPTWPLGSNLGCVQAVCTAAHHAEGDCRPTNAQHELPNPVLDIRVAAEWADSSLLWDEQHSG